MSFFSNLFGKSKKAAPSPGEAIQKLRDVEEMLTKKQEFLEKKRDEELLIIKKNGTKNKRVSLQALKRKKRIEKQLEQIDGLFVFLVLRLSIDLILFLFFEFQRNFNDNRISKRSFRKCQHQHRSVENYGRCRESIETGS